MEKILAIAVLIVFVWWAAPHIAHGEWIAPTAVMPGSWVANSSDYAAAAATPPEGYGWFHFDFWNNPSTDGREVVRSDFRLQR